jgi:DNA-binding SARP family transcriptional activator
MLASMEGRVVAARSLEAVIQGKLKAPALPDRYVARPRVEGMLAALIDGHRVTAVSAAAGAGKTTAVAQAIGLLDRRVAWLAVDRTDTAPGRLLTYLEAALASVMPELRGIATSALAGGLPHVEAAGLLAEAAGAAPVVLVLDDLERLGDADAAWAVVESLVRYAPEHLRLVLVSRRPVPARVFADPVAARTAAVGDRELAFTVAEAGEALARLGTVSVDPADAVKATGGWVTGVLFEAWRASDHMAGIGGESDPLHGYLASHILEQLGPAEREFLVRTAVLDGVTASRAQALGERRVAERLEGLRRAHLPVRWEPDGTMRAHPRFQEYLVACLERRDPVEVRALRLAHGRLLVDEGHHEEAAEEFLRAGAPEEALEPARRAIIPVIERLDFPVADRWLEVLAKLPGAGASLAVAEIMLAFAQADFRRAVRVADRLTQSGEREQLASSSTRAAALLAWTYLVQLRLDDAQAILAVAPEGWPIDVIRYALPIVESGPPPDQPDLTGDPFDALVLACDVFYGRLDRALNESSSRWIDAISGARRVWALRALGRTQEGLELYTRARAQGLADVQLESWAGPEVLIDAGRKDAARAAIARGRRLARLSGSLMHELKTFPPEAKLALRLERDPAAARRALDHAERYRAEHPSRAVFEEVDTWYGLALLREGEDRAALERLRLAVEGMVAGERMLELPTAAVYLAEAEWRAENEDASDRAADLALWASRRLGSDHVLLQALADFPAVVSRRIDAEPDTDSTWHRLGRALIVQGAMPPTRVPPGVELREFGPLQILVDGREVRPRIAKAYELLAYLLTRRGNGVGRPELLNVLFDGRDDESTRAYLRQTVHQLRRALPEDAGLEIADGCIRVSKERAMTSDSIRFEAQIAEAIRLQGGAHLDATARALEIFDRSEYLPGVESEWAEERRERLAELATDARLKAAELAFEDGRHRDAQRLADQVLEADPLRESAWRLRMRLASALGDDDGVVRAYQRCRRALASVDAAPSANTYRLLERLRR